MLVAITIFLLSDSLFLTFLFALLFAKRRNLISLIAQISIGTCFRQHTLICISFLYRNTTRRCKSFEYIERTIKHNHSENDKNLCTCKRNVKLFKSSELNKIYTGPCGRKDQTFTMSDGYSQSFLFYFLY